MRNCCWICGSEIVEGAIELRLRVNPSGAGAREARRLARTSRLVTIMCAKCLKSPGGRKARPKLWRAMLGVLSETIAHIENKRDVGINLQSNS